MVGSSLVFTLILLIGFAAFAQTDESASDGAQKTLSGLNLKDFESEKEKEGLWQNNPFVQPAEEISLDQLILTGIVYGDANDSGALISGQVFKKGDKIGYSEIVSIEKDKVILRNENGLFHLVLKNKTVSNTVNEGR